MCALALCVCVSLSFFSNFNTYPIFVLLWSWLVGLSICIPYCIFWENVRIHLARVSIQLPPRYWAMNTVPKSMMIKEDLILWYILPNTWNQPEHVGHGHGHFPSMMVLWQHWNQKEDRTSLQSTKNWLRLDLNWLNWKLQSFVCSCLLFLVCYLLWIWHSGMWIMAQIYGIQSIFNHFQPCVKLSSP